jgi:hypothetical protein
VGLGSFFKEVGDVAKSAGHGVMTGVNWWNSNVSIVPDGVKYSPVSSTYSITGPDGTSRGMSPIDRAVNHQVENASRVLLWLYDNGVSQPISTTLMAGELKGGPLSAHNWATAWHAANHISPGQALFLGSNFYGQDPSGKSSTQKAVNSPLAYYKPGSAYLPPGFDQLPEDQQQDFLRKAGMPATGNAYINELRQSSKFFKNASGVGDLALRWWGDPVVLAGKVISGERAARQVIRRPKGGWSPQDIDSIMEKSTMGKAVDFIYANKDNPQLLNNLAMAKNSALGPRFGAIASLLQTPEEVHAFLRVGLGDVGAAQKLQSQNALAASRLEQDTSRVAALDLMATRFDARGTGRASQYAALARQAMKSIDARVNADDSLVTRYSQILDHSGELDQVNLSRWSFAKAQAATDAQAAYRARAARGARAGHELANLPEPLKATRAKLAPDAERARTKATRDALAAGRTAQEAGRAGRMAADAVMPFASGFVKTRLYGAGDFFSTPVTVVRSFANARPNGFMRIDDIDKDSVAELRGQIARIPGISNEARLNMLNEYLRTTSEPERLALLKSIGATGAAKMAEKHGLDPQAGLDIYKQHLSSQAGEIDNMKRYSAARMPIQLPDGSMAAIHVDEFASDGGKLVLHPNLVTKLASSHVFQDLDQMDKVLARNASSLKAIRASKLGNPDWILDRMDQMNSLFKFGTLFRLGYIPRVAGDDLAGQMARLGAASMALRIMWGVRNGATNIALRGGRPWAAAQASAAGQGVEFATAKMGELQERIKSLQAQVEGRRAVTRSYLTASGRKLATARELRAALPPDAPAAKVAAMDANIAKHQLAVDRASRSMSTGVGAKNIKLQDLQAHHAWLDQERAASQQQMDEALAKVNAPKVIQGSQRVHLGNGVYAPAALEGKEGGYFLKAISSDESIGQIFMTNKRLIHGHLMRSFDHGGKAISPAQDEALHATSWAHAINAQIMQDPLAAQAVRGASPEGMTKWLTSTAEGRQYQRRIGLTPGASSAGTANRVIADPEDLANRAWHEVAEYLPTPEIRMKALEPSGVTPEFLKDSMPMTHRPDVHTGQVGLSQGRFQGAMSEIMGGWYKWAASQPADRWSRHPLFNQMYEDHLQTLASQLRKQGAYDTTAEGVERMATTARRLALRDTRKLVFDIAHKSDAAAALRLVSPFMAATTEAFQRWGRIIADRPQVVGYASNFFNAPIAKGSMQDADGNHVTRGGYSYTIDSATGKSVRRLVPKSERYIVGRMPRWLLHTTGGKRSPFALAFGAEPSSRNFRLSQNSMDLVTQGDPWFHPGVGPIVQIPVNHLVKDKPKQAELARHLGILPFGPQNGGAFGSGPVGEALSFFAPSTIKNFLTAYDTSDSRYQDVKMQIMQRAAFEHDQLGKPMPSAKQISAMTRQYWQFSAASAFLQPMATQKADNYQFFRDQYNALRRENPLSADDEFLARYAESYFIFAQSQSRNVSGIPATTKAVELQKKYGDLIAENPELGALVVGPEGNGPFSPEAYSYQLNTPVTPGGAEMQRTKMSATDALAENQRRLGWSKFSAVMNGLNATLRNRGLKSFADDGAEDLRAQKQALVQLFGSPVLPSGGENPFYNEAWSKDYNTLDPLKYERLIPGLQAVANGPVAAEANRSDLKVLQGYLGARQGLVQMLADRGKAGGSRVITARANADLLEVWQRYVDSLIESDTTFGDLHSRYLARDLGYDGIPAQEA